MNTLQGHPKFMAQLTPLIAYPLPIHIIKSALNEAQPRANLDRIKVDICTTNSNRTTFSRMTYIIMLGDYYQRGYSVGIIDWLKQS